MIVLGQKFAREVLATLGVDPNKVKTVTITIPGDGLPTVNVEFIAPRDAP